MKGDMSETLENEAYITEKTSLLRLDMDRYESTKKVLEVLTQVWLEKWVGVSYR